MALRSKIYEVINLYRSSMINTLGNEVPLVMWEQDVLSEDEYISIKKQLTREKRITALLDILPSKEKCQFETFFRYVDEWYSWIINVNKRDDTEDVRRILTEGGVPSLPLRHVSRDNEVMKLNQYLHEIKRGEFIVIHGMLGSGKSTLIAETLNCSKSLVLDAFKKQVFWLTIGRDSEIDILTIQQDLCERLNSYNVINYNNTPSIPLDIKSAKQFLIKQFERKEYQDALVILNDVFSSAVIDAFDIGCKILVATNDQNITSKIRDKTIKIINLSAGFTEEQSLNMFSKSIDSSDISEEILCAGRQIHSLCKGFPLSISLLSSQLADHKEDAQCNIDRWDYYVDKLNEKNISGAIGPYNPDLTEKIQNLYKAIGMCIDSLPAILKNYYLDFALFKDDVNITPEVLCILWNIDYKKEIDDIMFELEKKSLVSRAWNKSSNVYNVHDLLLDYLKKQLKPEQKTELHRKLIQRYKDQHGDYYGFPTNDNYIFHYLGYHLKEAELYEEFPKLFLNLRFLEKKVTATGPADLLFDFKKYADYISGQDYEKIDEKEEFEQFIRKISSCRPDVNIVQYALMSSKSSSVFKNAKQMVNGSQIQYFEALTDAPKENVVKNIILREKIEDAVIISDKCLLIGTASGDIRMINMFNVKETFVTFKHHKQKVNQLQLARNGCFFLSTADDSKICIWNLNSFCSKDPSDFRKARTPSPQLKQNNWYDFYKDVRSAGEKPVIILPEHKPVLYAQFSRTGLMVATCGSDERLFLTKLALDKRSHELAFTDKLTLCEKGQMNNCDFTNDDIMLLTLHENRDIYIYETRNGQRLQSLTKSISVELNVKSVFVIPNTNNKYVTMLEDRLCVYDIVKSDDTTSRKFQYPSSGRSTYVCAAVSFSGKYVAVASANHDVSVFDSVTGDEVYQFHEAKESIRSLCWSDTETLLVVCGRQNVWPINISLDEDEDKLLFDHFDAVWLSNEEQELLITAALTSNNTIRIFHDEVLRDTAGDTENTDKIVGLNVCPKDGDVIYYCSSGTVHGICLDNGKSLKLFKDDIEISMMKVFQSNVNSVSVIFVGVNIKTNELKLVVLVWSKPSDIIVSKLTTIDELPVNYYLDSVGNLFTICHNFQLLRYDAYDLTVKPLPIPMSNNSTGIVKYCDVSSDFGYAAAATRSHFSIRNLRDKTSLDMTPTPPLSEVCTLKFSTTGEQLAVGYSDCSVSMYDSHQGTLLSSINLLPQGCIVDIMWSTNNINLLVILNKEIRLLTYQDPKTYEIVSELYLSIKKIVPCHNFNKFVTVDPSGHLHILRHSK